MLPPPSLIAIVLSALTLAACTSRPFAPTLETQIVPSVCWQECPEAAMPPPAGSPEAAQDQWIIDTLDALETCATMKESCVRGLSR